MALNPRELSWRRMELLRCGFPRSLAARVARDDRYDLHQLVELVQQGCAPALAVRILSPSESDEALPQAPSLPGGDGE
jgi:hypothetical protein